MGRLLYMGIYGADCDDRLRQICVTPGPPPRRRVLGLRPEHGVGGAEAVTSGSARGGSIWRLKAAPAAGLGGDGHCWTFGQVCSESPLR